MDARLRDITRLVAREDRAALSAFFEQAGSAFLRAAGTWDPMSWYLDQAYKRAGQEAQHALWGTGSPA